MRNIDLGHSHLHQRMQQRDHYYPSHSYFPPPPLGSMRPPPPPISQSPCHRSLPPPPPPPPSSTQRASPYNNTNNSSPYHITPSTAFIPPQTSSIPPTSPVSERRPPVEFNHAINYVNRIKVKFIKNFYYSNTNHFFKQNRFAHNPDIYKQFLEILQTYQKEQKPIGEVYSHVQFLFNGADDLLEEFKQFLPEITLQQPSPPSNNHGNGIKRHTSIHSNASSPSIKKKKTQASQLFLLIITGFC